MRPQSDSDYECIDAKECKKYEPKHDLHHFCKYNDCNAVFKRLYRLKRHERQHTGERPFVCPMDGCLRSFTCRTYLNKHLKRPHNNDNEDKVSVKNNNQKQYNCEECEKVFKTKFQLRIHSYQHNKQKPLKCDKCEKEFSLKSKLKSHMKTHDGYVCGRDGCDFIANKWTELRKHISISHKCYKCDVCSKKFNSHYNMIQHKDMIHLNDGQKFDCTHEGCNKSYARKSSLMTHIRSAHNEQQFRCSEEGCEKLFKYKKSLNAHLEAHRNPKPKKKGRSKSVRNPKVSQATQLSGVDINQIMTECEKSSEECKKSPEISIENEVLLLEIKI